MSATITINPQTASLAEVREAIRAIEAARSRTCPVCDGEGILFEGAPGAPTGYSEACDYCAGRGRVIQ
jgi:DnaJ-class molecular chaperone